MTGAILTNANFVNADLRGVQATASDFADIDQSSFATLIIDQATAQRLNLSTLFLNLNMGSL